MNYFGAEPALYQLRNYNFLSNIKFTLEYSPFPRMLFGRRGLLYFSELEGRGIKPPMIKGMFCKRWEDSRCRIKKSRAYTRL